MDVIYNCCRISDNVPYYEECNAVNVLVEFRNDTEHLKGNDMNITALFTLAYLINDKNNDIIVPNSRKFIFSYICYNSTSFSSLVGSSYYYYLLLY